MKRRGLIAIIAAVVLIVAGAIYFATANSGRSSSQPQTVTIWVAKSDIKVGASDTEVRAATASQQVSAASVQANTITDLAQISGKVTVAAITAGQPLTLTMFATTEQAASTGLPSGTIEIAVQLTAVQSVGGQLRAGDKVSIFVTASTGTSSSAKEATRRVAVSAPVTKVVSGGTVNVLANSGTTGATPQPTSSASSRTATSSSGSSNTGMMLLIAVSPDTAARLIMASKSGAITLARENSNSDAAQSQSATITVDKVLG